MRMPYVPSCRGICRALLFSFSNFLGRSFHTQTTEHHWSLLVGVSLNSIPWGRTIRIFP